MGAAAAADICGMKFSLTEGDDVVAAAAATVVVFNKFATVVAVELMMFEVAVAVTFNVVSVKLLLLIDVLILYFFFHQEILQRNRENSLKKLIPNVINKLCCLFHKKFNIEMKTKRNIFYS